MRMLVASLVVAVGTAHAGPEPVNLLASVPSTVAVSSTVDNARIKPEHLVDGKPGTAWNSRTGELTGAWVAFRVPADAKVTAIKLTAGFTLVDKKQGGDLFLLNPRIKKVRVSRAGKTLGEFPLDITRRDLQELKVDAPGGDFTITVLAYEPGKKKSWREISISELEVWGTTPAVAKAQKPAVRLGSLDALPTASKADCAKAITAAEGALPGKPRSSEEVGITADVTLCRIDRLVKDSDEEVVIIAPLRRSTKELLGAPVRYEIASVTAAADVARVGEQRSGEVTVTPYALTRKETALLVTLQTWSASDYTASSKSESTLYRVSAAGLAPLLSWDSKDDSSIESHSWRTCTLPDFEPGAAPPKKLVLDCVDAYDDYHNEDPAERGTHETPDPQTWVYDGTTYVKKP